jgi:small multidrug resistance pump
VIDVALAHRLLEILHYWNGNAIWSEESSKIPAKEGVMKDFGILFLAILSEVIATTSLKFSEGFTRLVPSLIVIVGYGLSFYLLSLSLKVYPIGIAYAIWSGVGIVLTVIAGMLVWGEKLDWARVAGILLILAGVLLINVFSKFSVN